MAKLYFFSEKRWRRMKLSTKIFRHPLSRRGLRLFLLIFVLSFSGCGFLGIGKKDKSAEETEEALASIDLQNQAIREEIASLAKDSVAAVSAKGTDLNFALNELTYDLKKLGAEIEHLKAEVRELKGRADIWDNPLKIYDKEIIMDNGTTVYGKIIYQDERAIKVQTLIGYLSLNRDNIVRIVENIPELQEAKSQPEQNQPAPTAPTSAAAAPVTINSKAAPAAVSANCILDGNIRESTDNSGNRVFSGRVKNIGARRADFVKVNMIFRMNWSGSTKTLTTFVKGSFQTFQSGISSDNSLLPGAGGDFQLFLPKSFGSFIGYTYKIEWEEYE
jgi:hypothetical protein